MRQALNQLLKTLNVQQGRFKQPKLFNLMKMKFFPQQIARRFRSLTYLRCGFTCRREPPARSLSRAILSREVDEERVTCEFKKTITVMLQLSVTRVFGLPEALKGTCWSWGLYSRRSRAAGALSFVLNIGSFRFCSCVRWAMVGSVDNYIWKEFIIQTMIMIIITCIWWHWRAWEGEQERRRKPTRLCNNTTQGFQEQGKYGSAWLKQPFLL